MKIVILDGTHNKKGKTLKMVKSFVKGLKSVSDPKIQNFDLLNEDIYFCKGCNSCTIKKAPVNADCTIDDVCEKIKKKALEADVVVFATPIYEYSVSSVMKRFLERCLTLVTFRFGPAPRAKPIKGKYGVIFLTSGAPFPMNHLMGITWYPRFILRLACRLFRCQKVFSVYAGGKAELKKARKIGIKLGRIMRT